MLPVARNMLCKFSSCKIYYCKDIISKYTCKVFFLQLVWTSKSCIAAFFLQDSFLHFEILQEIVFSCKIYFLQDVFIKILARLARYLQVLARRFYMGTLVCSTLECVTTCPLLIKPDKTRGLSWRAYTPRSAMQSKRSPDFPAVHLKCSWKVWGRGHTLSWLSHRYYSILWLSRVH